jgi:hypothetical protein
MVEWLKISRLSYQEFVEEAGDGDSERLGYLQGFIHADGSKSKQISSCFSKNEHLVINCYIRQVGQVFDFATSMECRAQAKARSWRGARVTGSVPRALAVVDIASLLPPRQL